MNKYGIDSTSKEQRTKEATYRQFVDGKVFLKINNILELYPVSKSTWWAGVASGRFPPSVKLGPRTTVWRAEDINVLLNNPSKGWSNTHQAVY
ncbi:helix-turn-helix transcriptional regulator [Candidatus Magnetaquicoccus inordinatus]|uniref:helix-turn-helix transcriptional regulator n=1 Tax=Candidatus Magnetaquicoccus inordinatus TaxID=2496818 RepID=UPI00102CDFD7|nr:AlpA family phage regulatory protein [Candidatus Magnetaquicoccus inordinatus]